MTELVLQPNIAHPDGLYERLIAMHEGRDVSESLRLNARLILILANHIGDAGVLEQAIDVATGDSERK